MKRSAILDLLERLVDKSLVIVEEDSEHNETLSPLLRKTQQKTRSIHAPKHAQGWRLNKLVS
jgi:hypothetical protein